MVGTDVAPFGDHDSAENTKAINFVHYRISVL